MNDFTWFGPQTVEECNLMLKSFMLRCGGQRVIVPRSVYEVAEKKGIDVSLLQVNSYIPKRNQ